MLSDDIASLLGFACEAVLYGALLHLPAVRNKSN